MAVETWHVSVSSAASQQHKHHIDTFFCGTADESVPRRKLCLQSCSLGDPKRMFQIIVQNVLCGTAGRGVFLTVSFSAGSQFWGTEVRTHAVAGNGGSTGSNVDMVARLLWARVGCLFQGMSSIFRALNKNQTEQRFRILAMCPQLFEDFDVILSMVSHVTILVHNCISRWSTLLRTCAAQA